MEKKFEMKRQNQKPKKLSLKSIIFILITLTLSLGYVRIKLEQIKIGYVISENNKVEKFLVQEREMLRAKFTELKSPKKLESLAENLGFKFPTQDDIFFVEKATIVGYRK